MRGDGVTAPASLQGWAARWSLPTECLADLLATLGAASSPPVPNAESRTSESYVQSLVRLEAPRHNVWLTRNNVGALQDKTGRPVRYGLANETKQQNETIKSGDLIGIDGRPIEPWEVGRPRGRFMSRECKHAAWHYTGDAHEAAQLGWIMLVTKYGGDAQFVTGEGSFAP